MLGFGGPRWAARRRLVPKRKSLKSLKVGAAATDPVALLTPWVTPKELRTFTRTDLHYTLRRHGVFSSDELDAFVKRDADGRCFAFTSKQDVLLPFVEAAAEAQDAGLLPSLVDPEVYWPPETFAGHPCVPTVAVVGPAGHGKTALLDALGGLSRASLLGPTRSAEFLTVPVDRLRTWSAREGAENEAAGGCEPSAGRNSGRKKRRSAAGGAAPQTVGRPAPPFAEVTFIDTPGDPDFVLPRARALAHADAAVLAVSAAAVDAGATFAAGARGARDQVRQPPSQVQHCVDLIRHYKVPALCAVTKCDVAGPEAEELAARLRALLAREGEGSAGSPESVPVVKCRGAAALGDAGEDRKALVSAIFALLSSACGRFPRLVPQPLCRTGLKLGLAGKHLRQCDALVGCAEPPSAVGAVFHFRRDEAGAVLSYLVRQARSTVEPGAWFVAGTAVGQVLSVAPSHVAGGGPAAGGVGVTSRVRLVAGAVDPESAIYFFSEGRARRLGEYRRRLVALQHAQREGPPLRVPWEDEGEPAESGDLPVRFPSEKEKSQAAERGRGGSARSRGHTGKTRPGAPVEEEVPPSPADAYVEPQLAKNYVRIRKAAKIDSSERSRRRGERAGADLDQLVADLMHAAPAFEPETALTAPAPPAALVASAPVKAPPPASPRRTARGSILARLKALQEKQRAGSLRPLSLEDAERRTRAQNVVARAAHDERMKQKLLEVVPARIEAKLTKPPAEPVAWSEAISAADRDGGNDEAAQAGPAGATDDDGDFDFGAGGETPEENAAVRAPSLPRLPLVLRCVDSDCFDAVTNLIERLEGEGVGTLPVVHAGLGPVERADILHAEVERRRPAATAEELRPWGQRRRRGARPLHCVVLAFGSGVRHDAARDAIAQRVRVVRFNELRDVETYIRERCKM